MTKTLLVWLFGGALAASLSWNFVRCEWGSPPESCAGASSCAGGIDPALLGLDEAQSRAVADLCARYCREGDRLESRARDLQRELLRNLSRTAVDAEAVRQMVREIAELRERALTSCVDGILEVRTVLSSEQVQTMLSQCEHSGCR